MRLIDADNAKDLFDAEFKETRKLIVVYVHPKGRYIVAECDGVRETFFPGEILT